MSCIFHDDDDWGLEPEPDDPPGWLLFLSGAAVLVGVPLILMMLALLLGVGQ